MKMFKDSSGWGTFYQLSFAYSFHATLNCDPDTTLFAGGVYGEFLQIDGIFWPWREKRIKSPVFMMEHYLQPL